MTHPLSRLLSEHRATTLSLHAALESEDAELSAKLDQQMSKQFDGLLAASPCDVEEAKALAEHLLESLAQHSDKTDLTEKIRTKLLDLVAATHPARTA